MQGGVLAQGTTAKSCLATAAVRLALVAERRWGPGLGLGSGMGRDERMRGQAQQRTKLAGRGCQVSFQGWRVEKG